MLSLYFSAHINKKEELFMQTCALPAYLTITKHETH